MTRNYRHLNPGPSKPATIEVQASRLTPTMRSRLLTIPSVPHSVWSSGNRDRRTMSGLVARGLICIVQEHFTRGIRCQRTELGEEFVAAIEKVLKEAPF